MSNAVSRSAQVFRTPGSLALRAGLTCAALGLMTSGALANLPPDPVNSRSPILTPVSDQIVTIKVSADEIDACRATLADVLGAPLKAPMTPDAHDFDSVGGALPLPMVQCVVEARAD
ncbi:hypothetical protein [Pseudooceanicola nitratireducens]|uniref:hypothetical protein n=1 Tax=Pseudooceanicola nitratireducens TaxID=517719 RepID=UPI001C97F0F0|nr:hypothetical protein [Pseudooceanicola nitratireducens]MBY6156870.1 hypothetical protein [Pseudooceanicola nitratireducens]